MSKLSMLSLSLALATCAACALTDPDSSQYVEQSLDQTETTCTFVFDDCAQWIGSQYDRNRKCTQSCGGPAVCSIFNTVVFQCAYTASQCSTGPIYTSSGSCASFGQVQCGTQPGPQKGHCERSLGEP